MIIYTDKCLACFYKKQLKLIKAFCRVHDVPFEERNIFFNRQWQKEASNLNHPLPFIYSNNKAISIDGNLEELL